MNDARFSGEQYQRHEHPTRSAKPRDVGLKDRHSKEDDRELAGIARPEQLVRHRHVSDDVQGDAERDQEEETDGHDCGELESDGPPPEPEERRHEQARDHGLLPRAQEGQQRPVDMHEVVQDMDSAAVEHKQGEQENQRVVWSERGPDPKSNQQANGDRGEQGDQEGPRAGWVSRPSGIVRQASPKQRSAGRRAERGSRI